MTPAESNRSRPLKDLVFRDDSIGADDLRAAAEEAMTRLLPCDDAFWIGVDFAAGVVTVTRRTERDSDLERALTPVVADDPILLSFVAHPDQLGPRRQSDVATRTEWERSATSRLGFRGRPARHRLSAVYAMDPPVRGFGWSMFRADRDFTDHEVAVATSLHPLIASVVMLTGPVWGPSPSGSAHLTPREVDVLRMLTTGRTSRAIADARSIAEATVNKHIEHIYDKLGAHDRVSAVAVGHRLGYL